MKRGTGLRWRSDYPPTCKIVQDLNGEIRIERQKGLMTTPTRSTLNRMVVMMALIAAGDAIFLLPFAMDDACSIGCYKMTHGGFWTHRDIITDRLIPT